MNACVGASSAMSTAYVCTWASARPPFFANARICLLASASLSSSRAQITVIAPASANLQAAARPMPDEPPVTSTTLPATVPLRLWSMDSAGSRWRSQ